MANFNLLLILTNFFKNTFKSINIFFNEINKSKNIYRIYRYLLIFVFIFCLFFVYTLFITLNTFSNQNVLIRGDESRSLNFTSIIYSNISNKNILLPQSVPKSSNLSLISSDRNENSIAQSIYVKVGMQYISNIPTSGPYFILKPSGNFGRTNNHILYLHDFLSFAKLQELKVLYPTNKLSWEYYINFTSLNSFYPVHPIPDKGMSNFCPNISLIKEICPSHGSKKAVLFFNKAKNGSIDPYQYWDPYIIFAHSHRIRPHKHDNCSYAYHQYKTSSNNSYNCTQYTSNANTFLNFDYSINPQLFKDFYRHFKWNDIIIHKVEKFFENFRRKNFLTNLHYLALHIRLSDYGYQLPFDQEIIDTIQKELTLLIHRYPKVFIFIATDSPSDRRISLITQSFENLYMNVPDLISFKNPNERILFDMEVCTRADHFIGFGQSTLTFNVNMLRIFREKKLLNSSAFWPRLIPPQPNKEPLCCAPSKRFITCRYESTDCFPYINQPDYFRYYTRNIYNIDKPNVNKTLYITGFRKTSLTHNFKEIHLMIHNMRFILALSKIWRRSIIMDKFLFKANSFYSHFSSTMLNHFTSVSKKKNIVNSRKRHIGRNFHRVNRIKCRGIHEIINQCKQHVPPEYIDEIFKGHHHPFELYPLQLLNQIVLPSVHISTNECLNFYLNGPSDDCIEIHLQNTNQANSFDWSYDPLLLFQIQQKFVFNYYDDKPDWLRIIDNVTHSNRHILCVYIPKETNLTFSDAKFIINREINLIGYNDTKLFIAFFDTSSIFQLQLFGHYESIFLSRPTKIKRAIDKIFYDSEICHLSNRFISPDDSVVSFNINMMRWYGSGKQHLQQTSSYWPRILSKKTNNSHCCEYGSLPHCYSSETTNCYPRVFDKSLKLSQPNYYTLPIT